MLQRFAGGVRAAHKTGATDAVRTECSLFYLAACVVACVMTKENVETLGHRYGAADDHSTHG